MGARSSMGAPTAYTMAQPMTAAEPPEVASIRSLLHIARIIALIFGILLIIVGVVLLLFIIGVVPLIFGIIDIVIYIQMKEIAALVDQRRYDQAKSKTLVWMVLGFILGGIVIGILLLLAWLKFDPLITWQRNQMQGGAPPAGYAPAYAPPPAAPAAAPPPAAAPAAAPAAPFCAKCGKPTTYIPQYGRYYCYTDNLYV